MNIGFDITLRKCVDKSIYVSLECIECKDKEGKLAAIAGPGANFDNLYEALGYVRGLHDAVTMIQNQRELIENKEDCNEV